MTDKTQTDKTDNKIAKLKSDNPQLRPLGPKPGTYPYRPRDRRKAMESELALLQTQNGGVLTAEAIVRQAEDPASALHTFFTWDDDLAASKWRLVEARQLITSIKMLQEGEQVRSLVSLNVDRTKGGGYRRLEDVLGKPDLRQHLLETALAELNAIQRKYNALQELDEVWTSVGNIAADVSSSVAERAKPAPGVPKWQQDAPPTE